MNERITLRMTNDTVIALQNVSLTLPGPDGPVSILHEINLQVQQGEAVSVMGPSGSGKTSLMMVIAGVEHASSGKIMLSGKNITAYSEDQLAQFRRDNIGIVFQNFHLIPTMTALENVSVALEFSGAKDAHNRAVEALQAVGLDHRLNHYPSQLSGGEQQRVALARAYVVRPKVLLADEPTGNLDSETGQHIMEYLFSLQKRYGTTLLLITHDRELAGRTQRCLHMRDGRLHES